MFKQAKSLEEFEKLLNQENNRVNNLDLNEDGKIDPLEGQFVWVEQLEVNPHLNTNHCIRAFIEQNHQAHIQVHMAAIQNPKIQQIMQGNPQVQQIMAAAMAHIQPLFSAREPMRQAAFSAIAVTAGSMP